MAEKTPKTPAQRYRDAVWESTRLTPVQRIVALCYGEHAYGGDTAWVAQRRLLARTGIRSFVTATAVVVSLVKAGWLEPLGSHAQHKQRAVYRLTIPDESAEGEPTGQRRGADGRFTKAATAPVSGAVKPLHSR